MKILAISYMLPPMLFPQAIQIGRLLSHSRHEILAVSGCENQDDGPATGSKFCNRVRRIVVPFENQPRGIMHSIGLRVMPFYGTSPDVYGGWIDTAYAAIEKFLRDADSKPDMIVTFGEPMSDHLLGLRLKREFNLPWLAHFSDPWSDNPFRNIQPLSKIVNRSVERQVIDLADSTVFTSDETVRLVYRKYDAVSQSRASVLPHAYDPSVYPDLAEEHDDGQIILRYIGNFYSRRSPRPLIKALAHLMRVNPSVLTNVRVELVGAIPRRMCRSRDWKGLPKGLLAACGSVSYEESLRLMKTADILLTIDAPAKESVFFPSKLVDYIGSRKRLVGIVPTGAAARIIAQCGGRSVSPSAPVSEIGSLLQAEIESVRAERIDRPPSTPHAALSQYNIATVAPLFDALCEKTIRTARRSSNVSR